MYSPITLDVLRVLDAIDRKQSFAAAAAELFRVPSAISYSISKLEEELGVELFDRSKRRAVLTPVGRLVLEQGREILTATELLTQQAREAAEGWEVCLRIAIDSVLDFTPVYALVNQFLQSHRHTEIQLQEEVLGGAWDAISSDRCDLVIGAEGEAPGSGYATHTIGEVDFVFAVASDHPLGACPTPLSNQQIQQYPALVVADSSRNLPPRSRGLLDGQPKILVPTLEKKIEAHRQGLGVGTLPRHLIQRELTAGKLVILEVDEPGAPLTVAMAWRACNKGKALRWFIERLKKYPIEQFARPTPDR